MSTIVQVKRSESSGAEPTANDLAVGELAINLADRKIFSKASDGSVVGLGGVQVDNGTDTAAVTNITFADTAFSDFFVDTSTNPGTAIVRLNQNTDLDYGLITDEVAPYNSVDYGSI